MLRLLLLRRRFGEALRRPRERATGWTYSTMPSWWDMMSASLIPRSQSKTERNSRSMRKVSPGLKTPVHRLMWAFFRVESFKY